LTRQATLPLHALHRAYTSELRGTHFNNLFKFQSRRRYRVAHRAAHRWEPCEVCGIVEILRSENVRGDQMVGKAGDGLAHDNIAFALFAFSLARASFHTERRVGRHRGGCRVRVVVRRGFRESNKKKLK
jgi:hypothetical protein